MREQIHDQISAFIDDELSQQEGAFLVRRLERDTEARGQAMRYMLIGCALRGELQPGHQILRHRIQSALTGLAPLPAVSRARVSNRFQFLRPVVGFGIAATVAVAAVIGLRALNQPATLTAAATSAPLVAGSPVPQTGPQPWTEPASYVVPQDVAGGPPTSPIRLTNYLMRHGEYASGLSRTSVHSNVVGAAESAEQTFDESFEPPNEQTPQTVE